MEASIIKGTLRGSKIEIEGLWNEVTGGSWMNANGNPACLKYAARAARANLPADDNVYYGKIDQMGTLVHESEIEFIMKKFNYEEEKNEITPGDVIIFQEMIGQIFNIVVNNNNEELVFTNDTARAVFFHSVDCCERVYIEDICGELDDLVSSPILIAESVSRGADNSDGLNDIESGSWTFYKFATEKGSVTVRFLGLSNGYYSEGVDYKFTNLRNK